MSKDSGVGGAHNLDNQNVQSVEEATRRQLELNRAWREQGNGPTKREDERVLLAREKARAAKAKRRAKNPYDFSD